MPVLTRDQIRAIDTGAKVTESVYVPEWGGDVLYRRPSVLEQEQYWQILEETREGKPYVAGKRGALLQMCCVNEDGSDLFTADDGEWLGSEANRDAVNAVFNAIWTFGGITPSKLTDIEKKQETPTSSSSIG